MPPIAFFDVDKTLIRGYSGFFTTLALIRKGIIKKRRLPVALYYRLMSKMYLGNQANLRKMYQIAINDMAGFSLERILDIGRECFQEWIKPRIYREAVETVNRHKGEGQPVYLVTSGPYMAVQMLAEFLGVDGRYSAGPVVDRNGLLTPELKLPIYYREGKLLAAEEAIRRHGARWEECYFYSDSIDDVFLLEKVGHPRLVNPDEKLLKIGKQRGWPVLHFSDVLGKEAKS